MPAIEKWFLAWLLLGAAPACAAGQPVTISNPWFRALLPGRPAAGYLTLSNTGSTPVTLTGASSPECGSLMLHQSSNEGGMARMTMLPDLPIPAGGTARLAPGGTHLMCLSPSANLTPGHTVPVTLRFLDGSRIEATFPVRDARGR